MERYKRGEDLPYPIHEGGDYEVIQSEGLHLIHCIKYSPLKDHRPGDTATTSTHLFYDKKTNVLIKEHSWEKTGEEPGTAFAKLDKTADELRTQRLLAGDYCNE